MITSNDLIYQKPFPSKLQYGGLSYPIYLKPVEIVDLFENLLKDSILAKQMAIAFIEEEQIDQLRDSKTTCKSISRDKYWKEDFKNICATLDETIFNNDLNKMLKEIKKICDETQYILYYMYNVNQKLDNNQNLENMEKHFLEMSMFLPIILSEDKEKDNGIKIDGKIKYSKKDAKKFLKRYTNKKIGYWSEEQLFNGKILLADTDGYEKYLNKEQLLQIAKNSDENLLFIVENSLLTNREIGNVIEDRTMTKELLLELFSRNVINVKQLKKIAEKNNLEWEKIKKEARKIRIQKVEDVKVKSKDEWELLTYTEKLQIIEKYIDENQTDSVIEEIKELYKIEDVAKLYKKVYNKEQKATPEDVKTYNILSKMHNALGNQKNDEIIGLLEEQFSDELLENLYVDSLIDFSILEDYSGEELIQKLYEEGKIKNEDRDEVIKKYLKNVEKEELERLYKNDKITTPEMIEIYMKERTNLESIKFVDELLNPEGKVQNFLTEKELASMYRKAYQKKATQENINKYKRYKLLFQTCKREKLEEKQKIELDENLLEEIGIIDKNKLMNLYKDNLLTLETILKHGRR